jgi:flagellar motor switch protein FliM
MKYSEYLQDLKPPLAVNMIRMGPLRGNSVIIIDPNVVFSSLDSFFGGFGKGVADLPPGRLFTPTESRIIKSILEAFFRSLIEDCAPLMPIECEHISSEINPHFAQIADENDLVVLSRFEADATASGGRGFIDLVYPYATLKPVRELLSSRVSSGEGNEESDRKWRSELAAAVGDAKLELQVTMGEVKTTLHHLNNLQEGDLLFFKKDDTALMTANGVPAFHVNVGTRGSQVAVQIDHEHIHGKL